MKIKGDGFDHEKLIVLPESIVQEAIASTLLQGLFPVATGFFPEAKGHQVQRLKPLPEAILIFCIAGQGWVNTEDGENLLVPANTLAYIPPDTPHSYGASAVAPWSIHWMHLRGSEVIAFANLFSLSRQAPLLPLPPHSLNLSDFSEIHRSLAEDYTLSNLLFAAAQMRMILAKLYRSITRPNHEDCIDPTEQTIQWMRKHLSQRASLQQLAKVAGFSVAQYSAVFRRKTGYSPIDYFLRMKVQHACSLLDHTSLRIEEIATAVGYEDPFYFSRLFRRIMARSPRAYRSETKG